MNQWFILLFVALILCEGCRQSDTTSPSRGVASAQSLAKRKRDFPPRIRRKVRSFERKVRTRIRTRVKVKRAVAKRSIRPRTRVLLAKRAKWYRPRYRERRFRAPRMKLKKLPFVVPVKAVPWNYGSRKVRRVALTFDACSWNRPSRYDKRITDILIRTKTPATLFVGGKWVIEHKRAALRLAKNPLFEFANHTYLHGHLTRVSRRRLERELRWTQEILYTYLGVIPALYRPPFFESNRRVVRAAAKQGLRSILGDLPSGDPNPKFTKRIMTRGVLRGARNGSIVVMHMNMGGHHTHEALPGIIRGLRRKGFKLVKVSTILGVPPYQTRK